MQSKDKKEVESQEELMLQQHDFLQKLFISGNCMLEKDLDACVVRLALDIGVADYPEEVLVGEKYPVTIKWPENFKAWNFKMTLQGLMFALMALQQKKPDACTIVTVAVARLAESLKHLQSLAVGGLKATVDEKENMPPLE